MSTNFSHTAAYIWSLADLLRGDFKQSQYGRVILPFTILRRLECVLESSKPKVLEQVEKLKAMAGLVAAPTDFRGKLCEALGGEQDFRTAVADDVGGFVGGQIAVYRCEVKPRAKCGPNYGEILGMILAEYRDVVAGPDTFGVQELCGST